MAAERPGAEQWVPAGGQVPALAAAAADCRGCELWSGATQVVFSRGPADARLMLVGEQPGDREDREGEVFIGPAGILLAEALSTAGIEPDEVYVTNAVKHFRFEERGKRRIHKKPDAVHIEACRPWLREEAARVRPEVVVALGATAGRAVLGRAVRIGAERGRLIGGEHGAIDSMDAAVMITTHPSAVLRLRGRDGFDVAFGEFVSDLAAAAAALTRQS